MLLSLNQSGHLASMSVSATANLKEDSLLSFPPQRSSAPLGSTDRVRLLSCPWVLLEPEAADWISGFFFCSIGYL